MDDIVTREEIISRAVSQYIDAEIVVGIADASLVWACWIAERLSLPMAYVREPKAYGRERRIEGADTKDRRVILVTEGHDISTYIPRLEAADIQIIDIMLLR